MPLCLYVPRRTEPKLPVPSSSCSSRSLRLRLNTSSVRGTRSYIFSISLETGTDIAISGGGRTAHQHIGTMSPATKQTAVNKLDRGLKLCIELYQDSSPRHSGTASVNKRPQFYLPSISLSTSGMRHACLYSPAT